MTQTQDAPSPQSRATSGSDAADAPVTVHVTGFEPFDGAASNASWDAVRFLPDTIGLVDGRADLTRELLPVTFAGAMAASGDAVERLRPDVVVHVGLRSGAGAVMLETTARNEAAARIPDNAGFQPIGEELVPGGPSELLATWPGGGAGRATRCGGPAGGPFGRRRAVRLQRHALRGSAHRFAPPLAGPARHRLRARAAPGDHALIQGRRGASRAHRRARRSGSSTSRLRELGTGRLSVPRGDRVLRVGLTGGIGSGKSTVARLLAARGASIVDADAIAREVVEPGTPGLSEVVEAFGPTILTGDGALDRAALAERVFGDPGDRSRLEAITLPRIAQVAAHRMEEAGPGGVAVYDVPLLVEQAMEDLFDCVLVIETPPVLRLARLQSRGLSRQETDRRMAGQADDEERRRVADVLLLNNGTETDLADGVDWLWEHRIAVGIPAGRTSGR